MSIKIDLEQIVNGRNEQTNFRSHLIQLIFKADNTNRGKLAKAFPNAVKTVEYFQSTGLILDLEDD